jgi:hypothetical protein
LLAGGNRGAKRVFDKGVAGCLALRLNQTEIEKGNGQQSGFQLPKARAKRDFTPTAVR